MVSKEILRELNDYSLMTDKLSNAPLNKYIHEEMKSPKKNNLLVIYDEQGRELGRTHNKVVATGRVETIENLFRVYDISEKFGLTYDKPDNRISNRWISTFGVGSGGAPMAEGNNPYVVNPLATELTSPLTFRRDGQTDGNFYWDSFKKKDYSSLTLSWDKTSDDVYALAILELGENDLRGQVINEIGIYYSNHIFRNDKIINKDKFTLYAKANMQSINKSPLNNAASFRIAYKIFI